MPKSLRLNCYLAPIFTLRGCTWRYMDSRNNMSDRTSTDLFERLTDRQKECLRHVFQHRKSNEIAHLLGTSARAVDKQLMLAKNIIEAQSRFEAACRFAAYEAGVETSYPANSLPIRPSVLPLPLPLPTDVAPTNIMTWQQVAIWGAIIAIATPVGLTVAAMVIVALTVMLGARPN